MDYKEDFLDYLRYQRGLSINTLNSYGWDLKIFFKWANERELRPEEAKPRDIDSFLIWYRKNGGSIQSVNRKAYCLKRFYRWLLRIEVIERNPLDLFDNIKGPKPLPQYLTKSQQEALLRVAKKGNNEAAWVNRRNYLMILLLVDSGLRIAELCNLEMKGVNLSEGIIRGTGKGSKEREVVLSDRPQEAPKAYLKMFEKIRFKGATCPGLASRGWNLKKVADSMGVSHPMSGTAVTGNANRLLGKIRRFVKENLDDLPIRFLFFNKNGKVLSTRHAFRIIQGLGEKAGIKNMHPHTLRHTFATNLRQRGADLLLMREALGHSSVSTTQIYAHNGNDEKRLVNLN